MNLLHVYGRVLALLGPERRLAWILALANLTLAAAQFADPVLLGRIIGTQLHIKVKETVYHPGHYRVALAADPTHLPEDPETVTRDTEKGPYSVSAKIDSAPKPPVLVDGLFVHSERFPSGHIWETDVRIPNIDCENCTLQVIQWMAEHGFNAQGGYTYHHCAELKISADPALPRDKGWAATK